MPKPNVARASLALLIASGPLWGCIGESGTRPSEWNSSVTTLPSGRIVVSNPAEPIWRQGDEWMVVEDLRIGTLDVPGPAQFGEIASLAVDRLGRIWVLDGQANDLRVFEEDGTHLRTIGRSGRGPGEFFKPMHIAVAPDQNLWIMDPGSGRISVVDTAGVFLESKPMRAGFFMSPWAGGFDKSGRFYAPEPVFIDGTTSPAVVRYDESLQPVDTLFPPQASVERESFELRGSGGKVRVAIPFHGEVRWRLSTQGTLVALVTDEYRLVEVTGSGDTLRIISREFEPLPLTEADRHAAKKMLRWYTARGGLLDLSRLPKTKPPTKRFFIDDKGFIWVERELPARSRAKPDYDVFDRAGRFLGTVNMPFELGRHVVFQDGRLYSSVRDELDVEYLVRARITKGP